LGSVKRRAWDDALCFSLEHVVPVVLRRTEAFDGGVQSGHGASHIIPGGIGIEAAIELTTLVQQRLQPARVGPGPGRGEATVLRMKGEATDCIDGRLTEDDGWQRGAGNGEAAQVFLGAGRQAAPATLGGAAQFGPHGEVVFSEQQENGVGPGVGIQSARLDERFEQRWGNAALLSQILFLTRPSLLGSGGGSCN
jgi:hypothetical protein